MASHPPALAAAAPLRYRSPMGLYSPQNMIFSIPASPRPFGVLVRLRPGDPFGKLVGADWHITHWYYTQAERDEALQQMAERQEYMRIGDDPALLFEKVENLAQSRAL